MSFKLFIYYSAICGGWAALFGWALAQGVAPADPALLRAMVQGLSLGVFVALGVGIVDSLGSAAGRQGSHALARGLVIAIIGCLGGLLGGLIGQGLIEVTGAGMLLFLGWTLTGLLIGASVGVYDLLTRLSKGESAGGARRKVINGVIGGAVGGLLGSLLLVLLERGLRGLFAALQDRPAADLSSTSMWGFVALGACIGLFIGLAQVILKEAWVRVESGFRAGRELILSKPETTIGRAESCDIGLFGDNTIERTHARIVLQDNRYLLADAGSQGGTFLNGDRVTQPRPLRSGDVIQVGRSVLRFGERQKHPR